MEKEEKGLTSHNIFTTGKVDETIHYIRRIVGEIESSRKDYARICFYQYDEIVRAVLDDHYGGNVTIKDAGEKVFFIEFPVEVDREKGRVKIDQNSEMCIVQRLFQKYNIQFLTIYRACGMISCNNVLHAFDNHFVSENEKWTWYYRPDLHMSFRSSWEANIARILNLLHIKFEYESLHILRYPINEEASTENSTGIYIPDFVLDKNRIIEVKGVWDSDSRRKVLEFQKHFVNYQYFTIDSDFYDALREQYAEQIPEWEDYTHIEYGKVPAPSGSVEHIQIVGITFGDRKTVVRKLSVNQGLVFERDRETSLIKTQSL